MGRRRFFRYGELPLVLVALLAGTPRNGYDLLAELGRLFGPAYRPSPGSVYPALHNLAEEGLVVAEEVDGSAIYRPTEDGLTMLQDRREELAAVEHRTGKRVLHDDTVEAAIAELRSRLATLRGRVDDDLIAEELRATAERLETTAENHPQLEGTR